MPLWQLLKMWHMRHRLRSFLFVTKIMNNVSFSGYLSVCIFNHPITYNICDIMMSINTWDRVHFWIYFKAIRWVLNFAIKKNKTKTKKPGI